MRIYSYLIRFKLLSEYQFSFRKNSSRTLAISKLYDEILNCIDQEMNNCCIFLDLNKAFHTIDQDFLIQKLEFNYGLSQITAEFHNDLCYLFCILTDSLMFQSIPNFLFT